MKDSNEGEKGGLPFRLPVSPTSNKTKLVSMLKASQHYSTSVC